MLVQLLNTLLNGLRYYEEEPGRRSRGEGVSCCKWHGAEPDGEIRGAGKEQFSTVGKGPKHLHTQRRLLEQSLRLILPLLYWQHTPLLHSAHVALLPVAVGASLAVEEEGAGFSLEPLPSITSRRSASDPLIIFIIPRGGTRPS